MTPYTIPLQEISAVAASSTVTIKVPIGRRIRRILIAHGYSAGTNTIAATATNINQVRFIVDERVQRTCTGTEWRDQNLLYGTEYDFQGVPNTSPGVSASMLFEEPYRPDEEDMMIGALPTKWNGGSFGSIRLEIDLGAAASPTLVAWAVVDDYVADVEPSFIKWARLRAPAGSTEFDYTYTHRPAAPAVERLVHATIYPDSGASNAPTRVKLKDGSFFLLDSTNISNVLDLTNSRLFPAASGRTANVFDVKFDKKRNFSDTYGYQANQGLVFTITAGGAMSGNCTIIVQRYGKKE